MASVACSLSGGMYVWFLESSLRLLILAENIPSQSCSVLAICQGPYSPPIQVGWGLVNDAASHDLGHEAADWALPGTSAVRGSLELRMRCESLLPHSQPSRWLPPHRDTEAV